MNYIGYAIYKCPKNPTENGNTSVKLPFWLRP